MADETVYEELLRRAAEHLRRITVNNPTRDIDTWLDNYEQFRDAPEGTEFVWAPEDSSRWELLPEPTLMHACRGTRSCLGWPVARLNRVRDESAKPIWWHYCAAHLYGRRIVDGVLQVRKLVQKGSSA